jgi:hypothetical protein
MKKQSILFLCLTLSTMLSAQVSKTVNCTAGALSTLLSDAEKSTVTDLTLTGTIDARDFMTMRDNMPKLANIDMGTATIAAYQNNLANQIPAGAFCDTVKSRSAINLTSIKMPTSITCIGRNAFNFCYKLGNLNIPNSVTIIENGAFKSCFGISGNLILPKSLTKIGTASFSFCTGLSGNLLIPNSVTCLGDSAFFYCTGFNSNLIISDSLKTIGNYVFDSCSGLTGSLTIPNMVTSIGNYAFGYCSKFTGNLTIPSMVTSIGDFAFYQCKFSNNLNLSSFISHIGEGAFAGSVQLSSITVDSNSPNFISLDGVLYNKDKTVLIQCPAGKSGGIVIPNSVTCIGNSAFYLCLNVSTTLPNSLLSIEDRAFWGCGINGILTIPSSVKKIGNTALANCSNITNFSVDNNSQHFTSVDGILFNKDKTILIQWPLKKYGSIVIPNSVTNIGDDAFLGCSELIGDLILPNSVKTIGNGAFLGCKGFTGNLKIPNSVTDIKDFAFFDCSGFSGNLTISSSVSKIGYSAFSGCTGFTSIIALAVNPTELLNFGNSSSFNVFYNINKSSCILYVPKGSKTAYQSANQWKDFKNIVEYDPNGINDITADGISLYVTDGQLHIKNAPLGETVSITAISGMPIYTGVITTDVVSVSLPMSGVYIVTIGKKSQKVVY